MICLFHPSILIVIGGTDIPFADPNFDSPGKVDILLGVDIFVEVIRQGRRMGPPGSPSTLEMEFGWVIGGKIDLHNPIPNVVSHHVTVTSDVILQKFWEIEENPKDHCNLSTEEKMVIQHFEENHYRTKEGRFVVPLLQAKLLGHKQREGSFLWNDHYV